MAHSRRSRDAEWKERVYLVGNDVGECLAVRTHRRLEQLVGDVTALCEITHLLVQTLLLRELVHVVLVLGSRGAAGATGGGATALLGSLPHLLDAGDEVAQQGNLRGFGLLLLLLCGGEPCGGVTDHVHLVLDLAEDGDLVRVRGAALLRDFHGGGFFRLQQVLDEGLVLRVARGEGVALRSLQGLGELLDGLGRGGEVTPGAVVDHAERCLRDGVALGAGPGGLLALASGERDKDGGEDCY